MVDVNQSSVDLEPVQQDANGSWVVTPADDYVNLVPSRFSDINATKAWFDAIASAPVAFLPFDNNHSQPNHNGPMLILIHKVTITEPRIITGDDQLINLIPRITGFCSSL